MLTIIYEGETIIIHPDQLDGYPGCEVVGKASKADIADDPIAMASREHIASVHAQKAVEAALILSGVTLNHGLLAQEAAALGVDLVALAEKVMEHRRAERDFETARRRAKAGKSE